ncbi:MAG: tRNA pseudouridine(55) synthase TruB [Lachnospiraceae bacterium]|nr:tRNA pseudouridine(55) synthase TruB [Lachnospiraceae bacterium]
MINGVIIVKKEKGFTSHDVVAKLRGIVKQKKIGHTGTLDPEAEGVLPVCLGNATKLCDILTDKTKEYVAELLLGITTDTQDMTGRILAEREVQADEKQVEEAILSFLGSSLQVPPMYSALKINGKKLYELAREGKEVERKPRPIEVYELQILSMDLPVVKFRVLCSKGTYIRSLCADIGEKLSCGGCMKSLMRTKAGEFSIEDAHTLSQIEEKRDTGHLDELVIPVDRLFPSYRKITVNAHSDRLLENGNVCPAELLGERGRDGEKVLLYHSSGVFYGIYTYEEASMLYKPYKMFLPKES